MSGNQDIEARIAARAAKVKDVPPPAKSLTTKLPAPWLADTSRPQLAAWRVHQLVTVGGAVIVTAVLAFAIFRRSGEEKIATAPAATVSAPVPIGVRQSSEPTPATKTQSAASTVPPASPTIEPGPALGVLPETVSPGTCALSVGTLNAVRTSKREATKEEGAWMAFGYRCVAKDYLAGTDKGFSLPAQQMPEAKPATAAPKPVAVQKQTTIAASKKPRDEPRAFVTAAVALPVRQALPVPVAPVPGSACTLSGRIQSPDGGAFAWDGKVEARAAGLKVDVPVASDGSFSVATRVGDVVRLNVRVKHFRDAQVSTVGCSLIPPIRMTESNFGGTIADALNSAFHKN